VAPAAASCCAVPMRIERLNPAEDAADLAAAYPAFRAGTLEAEPGFPAPGRIRLRTRALARPGQAGRTLAAVAPDGTVLGIGLYGAELARNLDLAWINLFVPEQARKQGADVALMAQARRLAAADGRSRISSQLSAAVGPAAFADRLGGRNQGTVLAAVLDLDALDRDQYSDWAAPSASNAEYELVRWSDRCPEESALSYCAAQDAMHDQPAGDFVYEFARTGLEQMRADEEHLTRYGAEHHVVAALDGTGRVAGFAELVRYPDEPAAVDVWSTGVAREHRGHGLGLRLKAAASLWMRELDAAARWVWTANHEGNAAMLGINRALGYRPAERWYTYEFPVHG
jgi:GNAT superfamily N-acetyltransferase